MAFPVPDILTGTSTGASALITALTSHWNGTSTKFALSAGVAYDAGDTVCIEPIADPGASTDWQINLRRTSTTAFKIQLDPSGSITDAGSTSVAGNASTMASFDDIWNLESAAVALTWILWEWDDAIMFVARNTTNAYHYQGFHTGRVFVPAVLGVPGYSDGFGNLTGFPGLLTNSAFWFTNGSTVSSIRVGATGTQATDWSRAVLPSPSSATAVGQSTGGNYFPSPVAISDKASYARIAGIAKYVYANYPTDTCDTRLENPSSGTDRWIHIAYTGTPSNMVVPWKDATSPFP